MSSAKKKVVGVALITAIAVLGDSMLFIVLPLYYEEFGLTSLWQVGVLLSVNRFIRLPINPLIGWFYTKFQLRTGVFIALGLTILTTLSYGFIKEFIILIFMRILWGVAWSLLRLGGMLTVVNVAGNHNRGNLIGLYNGLWGLGGLGGMLFGGLFVELWSITGIVVLFASLSVAMIPIVHWLVPLKTEEERTSNDQEQHGWLDGFTVIVFGTGFIKGFLLFGFFASTISIVIDQVYQQNWSIGGMLISSAALASIIQAIRWGWDPFLAPWFGRLLDQSKRPQLYLIFVLCIIASLFMVQQQQWSLIVLLIALLIFQLCSTFFVTMVDTFAATIAVKNPVKVVTIHTVMVDFGAAMGPLFSLYVIDLYGLQVMFSIAALLALVVAAIWTVYFIFHKRTFTENDSKS
ncbi:hypothetical protein JCM19046_3139 [Bacillus sp. JCM 19046]|nr:hypothetical protein JCM19046_3139 [Bacillus sp. JCM 19046]